MTNPLHAHAPCVDLTLLKTISDGDIEFEKQLIHAFATQFDANVKAMPRQYEQGALKAWCESAHMMKGGALGIGAAALAKLCSQAQHFSGTAQEQCELYAKIECEYARVQKHLRTTGLLS